MKSCIMNKTDDVVAKKSVRFDDHVVVHEVCKLYTIDMWMGAHQIQANCNAVKKLVSMNADLWQSNDEAFSKNLS